MTDDTTKELTVEVPNEFDAQSEGMKALVFGVQKALDKFFQSYGEHTTRENKEVVVSVPNITLRSNEAEKQFPCSDVVEDTNTDK